MTIEMTTEKKIIGPSKLTKYERARVIGARALQISMGAPPLIMTTAKSPIEIAEEELKEKVLPITIRRKLPDGRYQDIPIKWLLE
ncbi:MAG: DNA-directed RNA polymerase subunit K [Candidatus Methanomethylicia archaeon]|nr:DNA-directed RNA polymerase subunit K [Candidatus Methanomethylicia archaeon]MCQ5341027.1 DNA-directed RNA polymerase subunit K [Candidatus Methanomethylicia archaeon]